MLLTAIFCQFYCDGHTLCTHLSVRIMNIRDYVLCMCNGHAILTDGEPVGQETRVYI